MNMLKSTDRQIVESTSLNLSEPCGLAEKGGPILCDTVDLSYFQDNMYQVDPAFVAENFVTCSTKLNPQVMIGKLKIVQFQWFRHQGSDSE
jgi:hypothetical protein